jgi:hypothetical protein
MNPLVGFFVLGCVSFLAVLCWIAMWPLAEERSADAGDQIEDLLPLHTQDFPQLKHSLDTTDKRYIRPKLSKEMERAWRQERSKILKSFVDGLARDFGHMMRLGRLVDSMALNPVKDDGTDRFWLALRFRLHFRILSLRISKDGDVAIWQLRQLTASVESLSALAEASMVRLEITAGSWNRGQGSTSDGA